MRALLLLSALLMLGQLGAQDWADRISRKVRIGDTTQLHQLILIDYSKLRGTVTYANGDSIRIQLVGVPEAVAIPTPQMRHVGVIEAATDQLAAPEPDMVPFTDLTLVRTALPYQRGMRIKTVMLIYNTVEWNLNRHFQLSTGIAAPVGVILGQRYRTSLKEWLHVGLSNEFFTVPFVLFFEPQLPYLGDLTTLLTIGDDEQFVHFGAGIFYATDSEATPNYRVGAGTRVGRGTHLYGELITFTEPSGGLNILPSLNVSVARGRHRWSFGLFSVATTDFTGRVPPIPYLSYSLYY